MHNFEEKLETLRQRLRTAQRATNVWEVLLNDEERSRLGDLNSAYQRGGALWMWAEAKQISINRATIDLTRLFGMSEFDYRKLLAVIAPDAVAALNVPAGRLGPLHLNRTYQLLQCLVIRQGPVWKWAAV